MVSKIPSQKIKKKINDDNSIISLHNRHTYEHVLHVQYNINMHVLHLQYNKKLTADHKNRTITQ